MTPSNANEYLHLVQAMAEGKTVQLATVSSGWVTIYPNDQIDFTYPASQYRVVPPTITETKIMWIHLRYKTIREYIEGEHNEQEWKNKGWLLRKITITYVDEELTE